ncbi:MAG TPA: hypothetical protein VF796_11945, partial [Humisphaera sp.]
MMNSEFAHRQAATLADRLAKEAASPDARVRRAYVLALGRPAAEDEVTEGLSYVEAVAKQLRDAGGKDAERVAWASYLRVLMSGNEFVFVE